jgi:hypothetical protein
MAACGFIGYFNPQYYLHIFLSFISAMPSLPPIHQQTTNLSVSFLALLPATLFPALMPKLT